MSPEPEIDIDEEGAALTEEADRVRSRLLQTVEELDHRRHDALDVKTQVTRHVVGIGIAGSLVIVGASLVAGLAGYRFAHRAERRRHERIAALKRLWFHPERAARREPTSLLGKIVRSLIVSVASSLVMGPIRRQLTAARVPRQLPVASAAESAPPPSRL